MVHIRVASETLRNEKERSSGERVSSGESLGDRTRGGSAFPNSWKSLWGITE